MFFIFFIFRKEGVFQRDPVIPAVLYFHKERQAKHLRNTWAYEYIYSYIYSSKLTDNFKFLSLKMCKAIIYEYIYEQLYMNNAHKNHA